MSVRPCVEKHVKRIIKELFRYLKDTHQAELCWHDDIDNVWQEFERREINEMVNKFWEDSGVLLAED